MMRPQELTDLLAVTIPAKLPVLIKGAPGVGKSDIVAHASAEAEANMVLMHPVVSDPTDAKGLPAIVKDSKGRDMADFLPYGDLRKLMEARVPTVAFLDDLGQAPAVVQAAFMQLILARQINGHKISDDVVFVAATNRREDKAGVTGILEPVKSRFATIVELEANLEDWCKWALDHDVPAEVVAFVRFRPELFSKAGAPTNDIVNRPCPRTITNMSKLFGLGLLSLDVLGGAVGMGFASEFIGFVKVFRSLPTIDSILINPKTASVPEEAAALYAVSTALASRVTKDNAGRVMQYAERLPEEFGVLCIRDGLRRCEQMANSREFIRWATVNQSLLS